VARRSGPEPSATVAGSCDTVAPFRHLILPLSRAVARRPVDGASERAYTEATRFRLPWW
jgi:hypothetical protein